MIEAGTANSIVTQSQLWPELLPPQKLEMDKVHEFTGELQAIGPVSHIRINIFPDGGLSGSGYSARSMPDALRYGP